MSNNRFPQLYPTQAFGKVLEKILRFLERSPRLAARLAPFEHKTPSEEEITLVMTLHPKDLWIAREAVVFAQKNVLHPIREILIISPANNEVRAWAEDSGFRWIDEEEVKTLSVAEVRAGLPDHASNRDTWIFQQLLKLAADSLVKTDCYLILDADTLLLKPRVFKRGEERWLDFSHERNLLYLKSYKALLGRKARLLPSYVCHHLFIEKSHLKSLKAAIHEVMGLPWDRAIVLIAKGEHWSDKDKGIDPFNFFSEYELYNNWLLGQEGEFHFQYFRNYAARNFNPEPSEIRELVCRLPSFYQWASFHSYYRRK